MSETKAMVPAKPGALTNDFAGMGVTTIGAGDIQMPRLKLTQALSQAVSDGDVPPGIFLNSLTGDNYGPAVTVVPVVGFKNRVYLLPGQGLLCRSVDMEHGIGNPGIDCASCTLKDWPADKAEGGPKCRESRNWLGLVVAAVGDDEKPKKGVTHDVKPLDEPAFIVLQFTSMASQAARKLNGLFLNSRMTNPTAQWMDYMFKLTSTQTKNDKGTFFVPEVRPAGKSDDAMKTAARGLMTFMAGKTLSVDVDPDDDIPDVGAPGTGGPGF